MLIDTHQHLIYRDRFGYGWTDKISALSHGDFTLEHYRLLTEGRVAGSIFMETGVDDADYRAEARFIAELIANPANRLLGQVASCRPEHDHGFEAWLDEGASLHVLGYRRILHVLPDETSKDATFRRNVGKIGARRKTFDICVAARQLPLAHELAIVCGETRFVLDHCGAPEIAGQAFHEWADWIARIAELDNVVCKLSGLLAYCDPLAVDERTISPYVDHVIDCFGSERLLWGSDWPVVNITADLPRWLSLTKRILKQMSPDEAAAVGRRNAIRIYAVHGTRSMAAELQEQTGS